MKREMVQIERYVVLKLIILFLLGSMLVGSGVMVEASSETSKKEEYKTISDILQGENLEVTATQLLEGYGKYGKQTALSITIKNTGTDFTGTVNLYKTISQGSKLLYEEEVLIPAGETKTIPIYFNINSTNEKVLIKVYDETKKKTVVEEKISLNYSVLSSVYVGVLTDDFTSLNYLGKDLMKLIPLTEKSLPEDRRGFECLDIIVINNFNTMQLSKAQYEAIKEWVADGGLLVVGTGANYTKTLALFQDEFLAGQMGELTKQNLGFGIREEDIAAVTQFRVDENYLLGGYSTGKDIWVTVNHDIVQETKEDETESSSDIVEKISVEKEILDLTIAGAQPILQENSKALISAKQKGLGTILIASIDLALPNLTWNTAGNRILQIVVDQISSEKRTELGMSKSGMQLDWAIYDTLSSNASRTLPKTSVLVMILLLYIIIVGPVSYIVFRIKDKTNGLWVAVPVVSLLFTGIIYMTGASTRIHDLFGGFVSITYLGEEGEGNQEITFDVNTPSNKGYRFTLDTSYNLNYMSNESQYYGYEEKQSSLAPVDEYNIGFSTKEEKNEVRLRELSSFTQLLFQAEKQVQEQGTFVMDIRNEGIKSTGTITNHTGRDYEYGLVAVGNGVFIIEGLKDEETVKVEELQRCSTYFNRIRQDDIWGKLMYTDQGYNKMRPIQLLSGYIGERYEEGYTNKKGVFVGFDTEVENTPFTNAIDVSLTGTDVVVYEFDYTYNTMKNQEAISNYVMEVGSDRYWFDGNLLISEESSFIVKYKVPMGSKRVKLVRDNEDNVMGYNSFEKVYGYNYESQSFELVLDVGQDTIEQLDAYQNQAGELILKYESSGNTYQGEYRIPTIYMVKEEN